MKKIIVSGKGGSGKTTIISLVLSVFLQKFKDKKVLIIDADPASNLLLSLGLEKPDIQPIGELSNLVPEDWNKYSKDFFALSKEKNITSIKLGDAVFDYGFVGHHANNSCLCSYNNALNYMLKQLSTTKEYDYVFLDREAGVEHINRSVYGREDDKLIVVAWPTSEYLNIAKEIYELADMLGTTQNRLLVINNSQGLDFDKGDLERLLQAVKLENKSYVVIPKLNTFDGLQKLPAHKILDILSNEQRESIDQVVQFIL